MALQMAHSCQPVSQFFRLPIELGPVWPLVDIQFSSASRAAIICLIHRKSCGDNNSNHRIKQFMAAVDCIFSAEYAENKGPILRMKPDLGAGWAAAARHPGTALCYNSAAFDTTFARPHRKNSCARAAPDTAIPVFQEASMVSIHDDLVVFPGNAHPDLTSSVCDYLGIPVGRSRRSSSPTTTPSCVSWRTSASGTCLSSSPSAPRSTTT